MSRRLCALAFVVAFPTTGCYSDLDAYVPAAARKHCKRLRKCNKGAFEDLHNGDLGRCRDETEDDLYDAADLLEVGGWEYDQDAGKECIKAYRQERYDCSSEANDRIADACADVLFDGF